MKKIIKTLAITLAFSMVFCVNGFAAGRTIPRYLYSYFLLQPLGNDAEVNFTPPAPKATANIVWKKFEAQLAKRYVQLDASGALSYVYKKHGSVKSCNADETQIQFNFSSVGYYQYQIRAIDLDGNYTDWFTYDGVPLGSKTTYTGLAVEEDDISPGGGSSSGSGSSSDSSTIGPGIAQISNIPAGYQYAVVGPNGEILYYYGGNAGNGIYNGVVNNGYNQYGYQYGNSQQFVGPGYVNNQNGNQIIYPNTGISNYQQVQAPTINGYAYNGNVNGQNINGVNNPNYYQGNATNYVSPQITQGMAAGWHVDNNGRFYYQGNGVLLKSTWYLIDGQFYRFGDNGYIISNNWFQDENTKSWYYLSGDGHMITGWEMINGTWYYFKPETGMGYGTMYANTTLHIVDAKWGTGDYAFGSNGAMVKNAWYAGHYYGNDGNRTN